MTLLESLRGPADLQAMSAEQVSDLAAEVREFLVEKVCATGGHLGPNLGIVELTLALHRVFESPRDTILFDVGHQSYVHKIITGRAHGFDRLRKTDGLAGYPARSESEHDHVENSHASTALSYADGLAKASELSGSGGVPVAVVGDGALTGGMCWEALNNIAARPQRPVVIVINDNGRSYSPTIGGLAERLADLRLRPGYERVLDGGRELLQNTPVLGQPLYAALHAAKAGVKDALSPQMLFSDLGLKYLGPVPGHDTVALERALSAAKEFGGPVIVHAVTEKGHGYPPAVNHQADQMHQTDPIDPATGKAPAKGTSWTSVFGQELARLGDERADLVAITAAMRRSTGLNTFAENHPDRVFDVGIAEQHAMTSAAGLAMGGMHPVLAVYSTFLNRAFDQLLMDVALHNLPVTLILDRAGITGSDGPSHNGMWDLTLLGTVPGMRVAAPRDAETLRAELGEAVRISDGPSALRFSKGEVAESVPALRRVSGVDVLYESADGARDVLLVAIGAFAPLGIAAGQALAEQGIGVTVVDPGWILPVPRELAELAAAHRMVVTAEDSGRNGGFGAAMASMLRDSDVRVPLRDMAVPQHFLAHGSRDEVLAGIGLTPDGAVRRIVEALPTMTTV